MDGGHLVSPQHREQVHGSTAGPSGQAWRGQSLEKHQNLIVRVEIGIPRLGMVGNQGAKTEVDQRVTAGEEPGSPGGLLRGRRADTGEK